MTALRSISPVTRAAVIIIVVGMAPALILFRLGYIYWPVYLTLATTLVLVALLTGAAIWRIEGRPALKNRLQGVWMSLLTLVIVLMALEAVCRVFVAWSDGFIVTLSEKNWQRHYWKPVNSLGYRDPEPDEAALAGKTRILAVGDSVTAGAGLEDIKDRYQNVLAGMVGDRYAVMTAAQIGWNSKQELAGLQTYPYPPDIVLLTYSVNDLDNIAFDHGITPKPTFSLHDSPVFPLISTSYFLNFAYYSTLRLPVWGSNTSVRDYQQRAYADPGVWAEHTATLKAFDDWAREHHAHLVVIVMPDLNAAAITSPYTRQVAGYFTGLGDVSVLDLGPELSKRDPRQMAVSTLDAHPNAATQRLFALKICPLIAALPDVPPVSCPPAP